MKRMLVTSREEIKIQRLKITLRIQKENRKPRNMEGLVPRFEFDLTR